MTVTGSRPPTSGVPRAGTGTLADAGLSAGRPAVSGKRPRCEAGGTPAARPRSGPPTPATCCNSARRAGLTNRGPRRRAALPDASRPRRPSRKVWEEAGQALPAESDLGSHKRRKRPAGTPTAAAHQKGQGRSGVERRALARTRHPGTLEPRSAAAETDCWAKWQCLPNLKMCASSPATSLNVGRCIHLLHPEEIVFTAAVLGMAPNENQPEVHQ